MTRRSIVGMPALAAAAADARRVRLGGPIFLKSADPRELAREHRRLGYAAAYCPAVTIGEREQLTAIREGFAAEDVVIAEVGAWRNLLDPDPAKRKENRQYVTERLAIAEEVGARTCVDIGGSLDPEVWHGPHRDNFSAAAFEGIVEFARSAIDAVKPKRTTFSVEMMGWCIPSTPEEYLRLIRAVDRPSFAVHIDVCNTVNSPDKFCGNAKLTADLFAKLGRWIMSCHAKDLRWIPEMNLHFVEVIPGRGSIDYAAYLRAIASLPRQAPLMLEHLKTAEEYDEGAAYIRRVAGQTGVSIS